MMAYQTGQPADSSKIRSFAELTRNNFLGIESGAETDDFSQLNVNVKTGGETGEVATFFRLYSDVVDSETTLKGKSYDGSGGNAVIFSANGKLGSTSQSLALQDMTFDVTEPLRTLDANFICHAYGQFAANGTKNVARSKNIKTVTGPVSSVYTITTEAIYSNANVIVIATCESTADRFATLHSTPSISSGEITFQLKTRNTGGSSETSAINFMILGGM